MSSGNVSALRRRVLLSSTMLVAAVVGYGRRAYGACVNSGGSSYVCSGAETTTQTINANNASVSTVAGFSVDTTGTGGNAITITGDGALSYTDTNASPLTAPPALGRPNALYVGSGGDFAGTPGSVTINTNGAASGYNGIAANNLGTGAVNITTNGDVTAFNTAIYAKNAGTNLTVTTAAGTTVRGGYTGIFAHNNGTGALTITANGNVTGTGDYGIAARNSGAGDLTVTTAAGTTVSGNGKGIDARNYGIGANTITVNGNVTGIVADGIYAYNSGAGTTLSLTIAAGATVSGGTSIVNAIDARNHGSGALTITVNGTVTSNSPGVFGIYAIGSVATVTVTGTGTVNGGIEFDPFGTFANRLELVTGAVINGTVLGGSGTDTLSLSGTGSGSFDVGQLSRFEAGQKTGSGTWTLTGADTEITTFAINGGTLLVNGTMTSAVMTVNAGGTLGGTGTVRRTLVSGGTFAPGSGTPGSFMTVTGTLGFNAASIYLVNVDPTTASFANVTGVATLGGATVNAAWANGSYVAKQYTILNAGGISGAFNPTVTNTNLPANFRDTLSYDATHAYLNLILNFTTPASGGLSGNQNNVANALINYFNTTGGIPLVFSALNASDLSQAAGQPGASTAQAGIGGVGQFVNAVFDDAFGDNGSGGATGVAVADTDQATAYAAKGKPSPQASDAYAAVTPRDRAVPSFAARWNVWALGYGGNSRVNGDPIAGTSTTTSRTFGTAVGATYRFTPDTQAGFALGGAGSNFSLDGGFGGGRADVLNVAAYAKQNFGAAYVAGLLGYSWQDTTTDRTVTIAGTDQLHANFKAQALTARLEGGWRYATPVVDIVPYAALQSTSFYLPGYGETATSGNSTFALSYAAQTVTATRGELGAKFDKAMLVSTGVFTLKAKAALAHDWNTERAATATFQALPGATFTVNGAQPAADAALTSLGAEMKWRNGWSLAANFDGEFSRTTTGYAGKGAVKYAW